MKTAACMMAAHKCPRVIQSEETRYRYGIQFDLAGQNGRRRQSRSRYFDFYEGLREFDTEFAWKVFLLA